MPRCRACVHFTTKYISPVGDPTVGFCFKHFCTMPIMGTYAQECRYFHLVRCPNNNEIKPKKKKKK